MKKVIVITGASSGMGKSAARILLDQGHRVYGAARRLEEMRDLKSAGAIILPLDLTDEGSIMACVDSILTEEGRVDVLINNAGYGSYGAVEEISMAEARRQFEVNLFGLARITQLILPGMRERRSGRIVNISSMGGKIYTPFGAWYHATKHALEGWSDCLRLELKEFDIDVVVVEPGAIKTQWADVAGAHLLRTSGDGPYGRAVHKVADYLENLYSDKRVTPPGDLGFVIAKAATVSNPRTRYVKGHLAWFAIAFRKWFGDRMYDWVMLQQMK